MRYVHTTDTTHNALLRVTGVVNDALTFQSVKPQPVVQAFDTVAVL